LEVKKGDFVLIDFVARVKESGEVFSTTLAERAKKERIFREGEVYEPMLVAVGEGWVLKGLDEGLVGLEVGKESPVEFPPEKGFGPRDPAKLKMVPLRKFEAEDMTPRPGLTVEIDGKLAVIRSVGAGRVQVDFNPPLAGKTLVYNVAVKKVLETKEEKIKALIRRRIQAVALEKFDLKLSEKEATIIVPEEAFLVEDLQYAKRGIATDIQKFFPEIETVNFIETFKKAPPPSKPEAKAPASEPPKQLPELTPPSSKEAQQPAPQKAAP